MLQRYFSYLESRGRMFNFFLGLLCLVAVSLLDWIASTELYLSFFYLFPIGFTTWYAGRRSGQVIALLGAANWAVDNHVHLRHALFWNTLSTFTVFLTITMLVGKVREMWEKERNQSRLDDLTGLVNSRAFMETLSYEVERFKRGSSTFSVGYVDLDEFKVVNDRYGHQKGDELLKSVAEIFRNSLRKTDVVARMGGDEFAIFFPGTQSDSIRQVMEKVRALFLATMEKNRWPTTFSMGVVTFHHPPETADDVILMTDRLMYKAKGGGKNRIEYSIYSGGEYEYPLLYD